MYLCRNEPATAKNSNKLEVWTNVGKRNAAWLLAEPPNAPFAGRNGEFQDFLRTFEIASAEKKNQKNQ